MFVTLISGTIGGVIAAIATILGAAPILFKRQKGHPILHMSLDFALGMMLAAAAFEMIAPAGASALTKGMDTVLGVVVAVLGGALFIHFVGKMIETFGSTDNKESRRVKNQGAWLFIIAMMLHNFPEGLASGAAWAGLSMKQSVPILGAIAIQNVPEGLMTALAFKSMGAGVRLAFLGAVLSGVVELLGGTAGGALLGWVNSALPFLLAFAGGAMLFVAGREAWERVKSAESMFQVHRDLALGSLFIVVSSRILG